MRGFHSLLKMAALAAVASGIGANAQAAIRLAHIGVSFGNGSFGGDIVMLDHVQTGQWVAHFGQIKNSAFCTTSVQQYNSIGLIFTTANVNVVHGDVQVTAWTYGADGNYYDVPLYINLFC